MKNILSAKKKIMFKTRNKVIPKNITKINDTQFCTFGALSDSTN